MREIPGPELDPLLEDLLATEPVDPELVLRYEGNPEALTPAERSEVEAWLATPAGRDAVAAMRELHRSGIARTPEAHTAAQPPATRVAPPPARARGRSAWLLRRGVAISLSAAALAVVWVWWPRDHGAGPPGLQVARETPELPVPPAPAPRREPEPVPEPVAPREPRIPQAPVEPPSASAIESPTGDEPHVVLEPASPPKPEPILLALAMPEYRRPAGAQSFGRVDSALRGSGGGAGPVALSPDHMGRSGASAPILYWYLAQLPEPGTQIWLAIVDESRAESLLEMQLPTPPQPGLQAFELAGRAQLSPGIDYTWSVSLRVDPEHPERDRSAFGWLRHEPLDTQEQAQLSRAAAGERPAGYARLGCFYDALSELEQLAREHPADPRVSQARTALLRQAGIDPAEVGPE